MADILEKYSENDALTNSPITKRDSVLVPRESKDYKADSLAYEMSPPKCSVEK